MPEVEFGSPMPKLMFFAFANMSSRFFPFRVGQAIVFPVIVENPDAADDADRGTLK